MCTFVFIFISLSLLNILLYKIMEDDHKVGFHRVIERSRQHCCQIDKLLSQQFIDLLSATSVQLLGGLEIHFVMLLHV